MTPGYVVVVEFDIRAGSEESFRALVNRNARLSATTEPGCRRFDVVAPSGRPGTILLYEIYDDRAAFEAHLQTDHYKSFAADTADLVSRKVVTTGDLICEGSS